MGRSSNQKSETRERRNISCGIGILATAMGTLVLFGRWLRVAIIPSGLPLGMVAPNTAIGFILLGIALAFCSVRQAFPVLQWPVRVSAVLTAIVGVLAFLDNLGVDAGIKQLFFREGLHLTGFRQAGTMSWVAATGFVFLGLALVLIEYRRAIEPVQFLALLAASLGLVALQLYPFYAAGLAPRGHLHGMIAVPSAMMLVLAATGVLFLEPDSGWISMVTGHSLGAMLARRFLPLIAATPVLIGILRLETDLTNEYQSAAGLILFGNTACMFALACWRSVAWLNVVDLERQRADDEVRQLNAELEARAEQRTAELQAANQELEAFAYSVSHDLRAPLRGVDGWSLALVEDYGAQLDQRAQGYLHRMRSETRRMGALIDDLLGLSRITRTEMQPVTVDLSALAEAVSGRVWDGSGERTVEFIIQPELSSFGDPGLLEVVLTNLLGNAVKFTGRQPSARIEFGKTETEKEPAFFVRDNGAGFDMAYADRLFSAFQRLHKATEFPGTGIGLAIVQRVIRRHGGRIWAEAQRDCGATFYFTLGHAASAGDQAFSNYA